MTPNILISIFLLLVSILLLVLYVWMVHKNNRLKVENEALKSKKRSADVRYGQVAEHLVPLSTIFKYDPKNAKFLGMPVDYIIFEEKEIIFLEVKTGESKLSDKQKAIKVLVDSGKVRWEELRVSPKQVVAPQIQP
jgi:predicted Holliday junction resolvase-like endonuclease